MNVLVDVHNMGLTLMCSQDSRFKDLLSDRGHRPNIHINTHNKNIHTELCN